MRIFLISIFRFNSCYQLCHNLGCKSPPPSILLTMFISNLKCRCQIMFTRIAKKNKIIIFFIFYFPGSCAPRNPRPGGFAPWSPLFTPTYTTSANFKSLLSQKIPEIKKIKQILFQNKTLIYFLRYIHYCEINFYFLFRRNNYLIIFLLLLHL